ncbi:MAG TPA: hydroxymethylbilane synthase [Candidatus Methylomirabilis sp.]|nr:hydroxymethylbilane synthase [Candidatus Methylomirabilis sp.]
MLLTEGPDSAFRTPHSALVIGTRGSPLALWQANHVADRLRAVYSDLTVRLEAIKTTGDKILDVPLAKVGGKALFVKEIEEALLERRVDLAVHSMKDVPTELPHGLTIGAVSEREDPHDVLITRTGARFKDLPSHARVGTSSLRRQAQLLHHRPDLQIVGLRGNLDTRIRKLATEGLDAIVVAAAGVKRLGLMDRITQFLPPDISLPAIGQGALGIEVRQGDATATARVVGLDHPDTHVAVLAERAFLRRLGGGCQVPFAAHARILNDQVILRGLVATPDGKEMIAGEHQGHRTAGEAVGTALAEDLLSRGAGEIIRALLHAA